MVLMPSMSCLQIGGIPIGTIRKMKVRKAKPTSVAAVSLPKTRRLSTQTSLVSPLARRRTWTHNNDCCWKWSGKRFENSGLILPEYAGKNVGVYVGGFMLDHMITQMAFSNRCRINQHTAAGMMMTMLSNRVSHTFDLRGPSLSMDTACSSSLVAFHYACQDVWRGACEMAVVGGSNVMMRPEYPMGMCKGHFLSRDGESKSFDSRGDGYGRGEGAGVVLIKPLDAAVRDGDNILATVIGTGTNQDGRTPGISMPNGEAQQALIEEVCEQYRVTPSTVDYVDATARELPLVTRRNAEPSARRTEKVAPTIRS